MKQFLLCCGICYFFNMRATAQNVPSEITFHYVQFSAAIGANSSTNPPSSTCTTFIKTGNKIISTDCNSAKSDVSFIITNVQQEKNKDGIYSLVLVGFAPDPAGNIPGFATYSFNAATQLWSLMLEDVADNKTDGAIRTVLFYYNTQ